MDTGRELSFKKTAVILASFLSRELPSCWFLKDVILKSDFYPSSIEKQK